MNRALACVLSLSLLLAGCSSGGDSGGGDSEQAAFTTAVGAPASDSPASAAGDSSSASSASSASRSAARSADSTESTDDSADGGSVFADVIANPAEWAAVSASDYFIASGSYDYARADVNGDGVDELLLRTNGSDFAPVAVIVNSDGKPQAVEGYVIEGAASAGGERVRLVASQTGKGVYQINGSSTSADDWNHDLFTARGGKLEKLENRSIGPNEQLPDYKDITWRPADTARNR